jgi:predicted transcriptional regulator
MPRLTITLSDDRHRALKEAAARRRKSITALIEESLEFYGIKSTATAVELVARSRAQAALDEADALLLANEET